MSEPFSFLFNIQQNDFIFVNKLSDGEQFL